MTPLTLPKHATRLARQDDLHVLMNVTRHTPLDFPTLLCMDCLHTLAFLHATHLSLGVTNMNFIVLRQCIGHRERHTTRLTFVRFLTRMGPHVIGQVAGPRERLAARLAYMWPLPRMAPHVHSQVKGLRERLAARLADMRPFPCMRPHVRSQVTGLGERIAARLADMRLLPRM